MIILHSVIGWLLIGPQWSLSPGIHSLVIPFSWLWAGLVIYFLPVEGSKANRILLPQLDNTRFIMSILLADYHLVICHFLGLHTLMKQAVTWRGYCSKNSCQPSANCQLETEDLHAIALKKMNSSIGSLDMHPSPVKPSDETLALAETL